MKKFLGILVLGLLFNFCVFVKAQDPPKNYLKGKFYSSVKDYFLVATKKMTGSRFEKTVIVMLENDESGAWGLVINKRLGTMPIALLTDPSLNTSEEREMLYKIDIPVFWGGPVDIKKVFVLHSSEYQSDTTKKYGNISISQDYNTLLDIAENKGPKKSLVILGYSGWGDGQLEGEMERDHWILSDIGLGITFDKDSNTKWNKAFKNSFIKI